MGTVTVNAPKAPVTTGSSGGALTTLPNICKMRGPPASFGPTKLDRRCPTPRNLPKNTWAVASTWR